LKLQIITSSNARVGEEEVQIKSNISASYDHSGNYAYANTVTVINAIQQCTHKTETYCCSLDVEQPASLGYISSNPQHVQSAAEN